MIVIAPERALSICCTADARGPLVTVFLVLFPAHRDGGSQPCPCCCRGTADWLAGFPPLWFPVDVRGMRWVGRDCGRHLRMRWLDRGLLCLPAVLAGLRRRAVSGGLGTTQGAWRWRALAAHNCVTGPLVAARSFIPRYCIASGWTVRSSTLCVRRWPASGRYHTGLARAYAGTGHLR